MTTTPRVPLSSRQRFLLELLNSLGGQVGNLDFQKLLFLRCQQEGASAAYEFVPYMYGAFSFTSYADRRKLAERGLLHDDSQHWELTPKGRSAATSARSLSSQLETFAREYRDLRGDDLVAETYRRFPYYATKSTIVKQVLDGDKAALHKIEAARHDAQAPGIATIGYEGHTLERYLNQLIKHGVTILCDVRRNAISRKYGFSKSTLSKACEGVSLRYEHLPELGIASEKRQSLDSQADYDALFKEYELCHLPNQSDSLGSIRAWVRGGGRVALTCYEHLPEQCHRRCVAEAMEERFGTRFKPQHL
jgi:uncharacterized protein (DUF488 family)